MRLNRNWLALLAVCSGALCVSVSSAAEPVGLTTKSEVYRAPDGQNFAALGMQVPAGMAAAEKPEQVLVLIDTSASQVGAVRQQSFGVLQELLGQLVGETRVGVWAIDVRQTPLNEGLAPLTAETVDNIHATLSRRIPAGSTDLAGAFEAALEQLDPQQSARIVYLGDGYSAAKLIAPEAMQSLTDSLAERQVPVISYALGSQTDLQLLGVLALRSGGYTVLDQDGQTPADAAGALLTAIQGPVWYPAALKNESGLSLVPNRPLPLRADRETIYLATFDQDPAEANIGLEQGDVRWQAQFQLAENQTGHATLRALTLRGQRDEGLSVPTAGRPLLAAAESMFEEQVSEMLSQANQAAERGQIQNSLKISQALLQLDPRNQAAQTMVQAQQVALQVEGDEQENGKKPIVSELDELEGRQGPPSDLERDMIERYRNLTRVAGERLSLQVSRAIDDARGITPTEPDAAIGLLKNVLGTVRSAADIDPEIRQELDRRVSNVILEVRARREQIQNQRVRVEQQLAEQEARRRVIEDLMLEEERLEQLIDQVRSLLWDGFHGDTAAYAQAEEVAQAAVDLAPFAGVSNSAKFMAVAAARLEDARYLRDLRSDRFLETLTQVEFSHVPFPDEPPIRWPSAARWKWITENRKKWASVDLKDDSPAERRIRDALDQETNLQFVDTPLRDCLEIIGEMHNITIFPDERALDDAGISTDEPITLFISGVRLRSALKIMLEKLPEPLTWVIEDEVMKITTVLEAEEKVETRVYPVGDLVIPIQPLGGGMMGGMMGMGMGGGMGGGMMGGMGGGMGGGMMGGGMGMFSIPPAPVETPAKKNQN